jgi:hypothetical protein
MKQTKDMEQLIDRAIANDRGTLPQQPSQPPADLLARVSSTPFAAANASFTVGTVGISLAVKIGIVAIVAAGSATWWALSASPEAIEVPKQAPASQQSVVYGADSVRKKRDSTTAEQAQPKQKVSPEPNASPFVPSEKDLPTPTGPLQTRIKDTAAVHINVK